MQVPPISISEIIFRRKIVIERGCFIEENVKKFKDKQVLIRDDYVDNKRILTLIYVSKAGKWLKSKLKVFNNGKKIQILESKNKDFTNAKNDRLGV